MARPPIQRPAPSLDPAGADFRDLEPLKKVLAEVSLVLLGEASHGDGSTLLAKTRLVHFLHREMGFDVLAFDCGFYDCDRAWRRIQAGADASQELRQSVFSLYSDDGTASALVVMKADGTGRRTVVAAGQNWYPRWSPDGRWLVYTAAMSDGERGNTDVLAILAEGGEPVLLAGGPRRELEGSWRPMP